MHKQMIKLRIKSFLNVGCRGKKIRLKHELFCSSLKQSFSSCCIVISAIFFFHRATYTEIHMCTQWKLFYIFLFSIVFGLDVEGRIILRWIFGKWEGVETGWSWLRIGTDGGHL